jgi:hypothetical protein
MVIFMDLTLDLRTFLAKTGSGSNGAILSNPEWVKAEEGTVQNSADSPPSASQM